MGWRRNCILHIFYKFIVDKNLLKICVTQLLTIGSDRKQILGKPCFLKTDLKLSYDDVRERNKENKSTCLAEKVCERERVYMFGRESLQEKKRESTCLAEKVFRNVDTKWKEKERKFKRKLTCLAEKLWVIERESEKN